MSFEDNLAVEVVLGLQAVKDRPGARRHVEHYLQSEGWLGSTDVIDLTERGSVRDAAGVRTRT